MQPLRQKTLMGHTRCRNKKWSNTNRPEAIAQHAAENATPASEIAAMQPPHVLAVGEPHRSQRAFFERGVHIIDAIVDEGVVCVHV